MSIKLKNVVIFLKIEICIHSYLTWGLELGDVAKLLEPIPAWCISRCLRVFKYGQPSQTLFTPDLVSEDCVFKISISCHELPIVSLLLENPWGQTQRRCNSLSKSCTHAHLFVFSPMDFRRKETLLALYVMYVLFFSLRLTDMLEYKYYCFNKF